MTRHAPLPEARRVPTLDRIPYALRRAAQSIPQNIAEGCGRTTRADKAKHYTIARGSAMESAAHLDVMQVDELIDTEHYARGTELLERIVAMLTKLIDL